MSKLEVIGFAFYQSTGKTVPLSDMTADEIKEIGRKINRQFIKGMAQRMGAQVEFKEKRL